MKSRNYLIALAIHYQGNYESVLRALTSQELLPQELIDSYLSKIKSKVITLLDPDYPEYLRKVYKPPFVLFYYGDISLINDYQNNLAVVGSRNASQKGLENTYDIVFELAKKYNIVSGLAKGIDAVAHRAAITGGGKTIAILGCGIEECYPSSNKDLYDEIKKNHLLISEYFGYIPPYSENFPQRNRLIVAFSKGTLVGEASSRSGSLITANLTLDANKDLMCLPSSDIKNSACNICIKEGAPVVTEAEDIIEYLK